MKSKKILVTGGAGFIGSAIVEKLVKEGHKVSVLDNCQRGSLLRINHLKKKIKIFKGDIRNKKLVERSLKNIDTVIHLAYVNGTKFFYKKPAEIVDIAIRGMLNVIDGCKKNKVNDFILFSSSEAYADPKMVPTPEEVPLQIPDIDNPRYSYGGGKIACELMLKHMCSNFVRTITIRPHNVYGTYMGNSHVIPEFFQKIRKLKKIDKLTIQGDGLQTRSFIHIEDFIDAFYLVFKKGKKNEIYHLGTNEEIKIIDLAKKILNISNKKNLIKRGKITKGSPIRRQAKITKITKLGFKKKININDGLKKIFYSYNRNDKNIH